MGQYFTGYNLPAIAAIVARGLPQDIADFHAGCAHVDVMLGVFSAETTTLLHVLSRAGGLWVGGQPCKLGQVGGPVHELQCNRLICEPSPTPAAYPPPVDVPLRLSRYRGGSVTLPTYHWAVKLDPASSHPSLTTVAGTVECRQWSKDGKHRFGETLHFRPRWSRSHGGEL